MSKVAKWIFPAAGGVKGIVGTALAVVGFATGNTSLILSGASMVAGAGKKTQGQARQASILSLTLGETQREAAIGQVCTGGSLVDVFNFGGQYGTDKVTRCVALADHAIDGMVGFYIDDTFYPWVGDGQQAAFNNKLSFHFRQATADGHAPPQHVLENGGWTATDRMVGITHIWIDWYVDEKVWPQGHPAIRFVFRGLRVYDPRFDPRFGYTGPSPQTWADRSSHRFSRNAKILRYAYTRGIYAEGHHGDPNYLLIGRGLTEEEAPAARVIPDANLCDEMVDGVPRYCADGMISASQQFIEVDGMFAAAMAGQIVQREGSVDVEAGQAKAVVVTITDDDLVVGEPVSFSRFLPDNDGGRINTVIGRYIEPSLGYKDHSAPVRRSLTDIQADGGPREQTLSLPLVTDAKQVDRVIEIQRLMARLERCASIVLPPKFAGLEEGDWIAWQSNRRHNGATVRYQVQAYRQPETWRMYLTLREIASSVFGVPDPVEDTTTPPPPPQVIDALQLLGVEAEAFTLPGETSTIPAVRFKWDVAVDAAVLAIRAEVRRVGETDAAPTRIDDVAKGQANVTNGVGPDQALECRLVPIGDPSRPVLASNWITVSTSTIVAGDLSPESPVRIAVTEITNRLVSVEQISATNAAAVADLE
ncbi:phage tail protein, partial [Brevundimonas sp.]|uniref:phage tail protein n=1 Tax=Brevundimonas sp. TaxID=1871086 RepID=UPI0028A20E93